MTFVSADAHCLYRQRNASKQTNEQTIERSREKKTRIFNVTSQTLKTSITTAIEWKHLRIENMHNNSLLLTLKSLLVKSTPRTNGNTPVLAIFFGNFDENFLCELMENNCNVTRAPDLWPKIKLIRLHTHSALMTMCDRRSETRNRTKRMWERQLHSCCFDSLRSLFIFSRCKRVDFSTRNVLGKFTLIH